MKRRWGILLTASMVTLLAACGNSSEESANGKENGKDKEKTVEIWSFTDEISTMINDYYLPSHPDLDYKINVVTTPTEQFEAKLDPILGSKDAPDVVLMEGNFAKKYVESGMLTDLDQFSSLSENLENTYDYVKEVGTNKEGVQVANAWQAAPGAFFYRDSFAKEYLGIETPEDMQAAISSWDGFYETAKKLDEASDGKIDMISGIEDLSFPFYSTREKGWVVDNKLEIDNNITKLLEMAKKMNDEGLMLDAPPQSEAYFSGMSNDKVFGYSLPTWGLHFWLKPNAESSDASKSTAGDWRMVKGPATYFRGGTWMGVTETSDNKDAAADIVEYLTTDPEFLKQWAEDTGDVVSNKVVVDEIKGDFSEEFLGGQNHYAQFADQIDSIDASIVTEYDQTLNTLFNDSALIPYSKGEIKLDQAIKAFKEAAKNAYPDLEVD